MKYIWLVFIAVISLLISCAKIDESKKQNCYIGRIRISRQSHFEGHNIYVSLRIINNTNDTIFTPTNDSSVPLPRSAFVGRINYDKIEFREWKSDTRILPKDSISIRLISLYYRPKTNDSVFLSEIKNLNIEYVYPKRNQQVSSKYIKEIHIQRTPKTKFEILEDNKSIEGIFLFGNEEFK